MSSAADPERSISPPSVPKRPKGVVLAAATGLVGAALTGALVGGVLMAGGHSPAATDGVSQIAAVDLIDLTAAAATLDPAAGAGLIADAKACHAPLAIVTLSKAPDGGGIVRIRSGAYLSPPFGVVDAPQRIAIPFPAPYAEGHGTLSVEGAARGVQLTLYPTWSAASLSGKGAINVTWRTDNPCGK
jgi:hypothetical protein